MNRDRSDLPGVGRTFLTMVSYPKVLCSIVNSYQMFQNIKTSWISLRTKGSDSSGGAHQEAAKRKYQEEEKHLLHLNMSQKRNPHGAPYT